MSNTNKSYIQKMKQRSENTEVTPELLKKNNIKFMFDNNRGTDQRYQCGCCDITSWMPLTTMIRHINTEKHMTVNKKLNKIKQQLEEQTNQVTLMTKKYEEEYAKRFNLQNKYEEEHRLLLLSQDTVKELKKHMNKNGTYQVLDFMNECEEFDYIEVSEDDEVTMPSGDVIIRHITYWTAPTNFDELYTKFCLSRDDEEEDCDISKEDVKEAMLEFQECSSYGLEIGKYDEELKKNGTYENPKFNFNQ